MGGRMSNEVAQSPVSDEDSEDQPIQLKMAFKGDQTENQDADHIMPPLLEYIDANVIGRDTVIEGPYGKKQVVYCDYTASGKPLRFIEDYINNYVYSFYANTHTSTTTTSRQTTKFRNDAREIIKNCVNATEKDVVIFTGSGTTGGIHKLVHALLLEGEEAKKTVVFVGPFEHHSNMLPWKETGAKIERIKDNESGTVCMYMLEDYLKKYKESGYRMYAAFSAASNVTGIMTDTVAVAEMCHKYGALSFWDYATAAPYLDINMNPTINGYKDAVFLSPHKFVGGPGTPGILIAKKHVFKNPVPGGCGGGTVLFVTRDTHLYLKDIEVREEGGTPGIVESIRAGLVFQLKQSVTPKLIEEREEELCKKAFSVWKKNPCLTILGSDKARRLPIFSFIVYHQVSGKLLHHNFVSTLLNDLYGIQARGGCACAGPYALDLLGVSDDLARKFTWFFEDHQGEQVEEKCRQPLEIMKPGFARINLPYFMDDETVHFVLEAVDMVATHGWKLLPQYTFDSKTGSWRHRKHSDMPSYSLHDITYDDDGIHVTHTAPPPLALPMYTFEAIAREASKIFEEAAAENNEISTLEDEVIHFQSDDKEKLVWFLQPQEAQIFLATESLKFKPFKRTSLPFRPRRLTRNYSKTELLRRQTLLRSMSETTEPIPEDEEAHEIKVDGITKDQPERKIEDDNTTISQTKCKKKRKSLSKFGKKQHPIEANDSTVLPEQHKGFSKRACVIQ